MGFCRATGIGHLTFHPWIESLCDIDIINLRRSWRWLRHFLRATGFLRKSPYKWRSCRKPWSIVPLAKAHIKPPSTNHLSSSCWITIKAMAVNDCCLGMTIFGNHLLFMLIIKGELLPQRTTASRSTAQINILCIIFKLYNCRAPYTEHLEKRVWSTLQCI